MNIKLMFAAILQSRSLSLTFWYAISRVVVEHFHITNHWPLSSFAVINPQRNLAAFLIQIIPNIVTCMTAVEMHALSPALVFLFFFHSPTGSKRLGFQHWSGIDTDAQGTQGRLTRIDSLMFSFFLLFSLLFISLIWLVDQVMRGLSLF